MDNYTLDQRSAAQQDAHDDGLPDGPGRQLRILREQRQLSQADVANALRLGVDTIRAVEEEDYLRLPPTTFVRGYIRNYARLLDVNPGPLLDAIPASGSGEKSSPLRVSGPVHTAPQMSKGMRLMLPLGLLGIVIVAAGYGARDTFQEMGWSLDVAELIRDIRESRGAWSGSTPDISTESSQSSSGPRGSNDQQFSSERSDASSPRRGGSADTGDTGSPAVNRSLAAVAEPLPGIVEPDQEAMFTNELAGPEEVPVTDHQTPYPLARGADLTLVHDPAGRLAADLRGLDNPAASTQARYSSTARIEDQALTHNGDQSSGTGHEAGAAGKQALRISFTGPSWIEVYDAGGRQLLYGLIDEGNSERVVRGAGPYRVVIGDTGNVAMEHDGESVDLGGQRPGRVARLQIPR